jgi:hypothetical protein
MSPDEDEKRPTERSPCAMKVACTVATGGWENTVWLCVLSLPTQQGRETAMIAQRLEIAHIKQVEVRCR